MKKKLLVIGFSLACLFTTVYAMDHTLNATSTTYNAGGAVTGRVSMAPTGISGSNIGFKKGDKVLMGTKVSGVDDKVSPYVYHNEPLEILLLMNFTYTDYGSTTCTPKVDTKCNQTAINAWQSMTTKAIDKSSSGFTSSSVYIDGVNKYGKYAPYGSSAISSKIDSLNASVTTKDQKIIAPRNLDFPHTVYKNSLANISASAPNEIYMESIKHGVFSIGSSSKQLQTGFYIPTLYENIQNTIILPFETILSNQTNGISLDTAFYEDYWSSSFYHYSGSIKDFQYSCVLYSKNGGLSAFGSTGGGRNQPNIAIDGTKILVRPSVWITLDNVVFATSNGNNNGIGVIKELNLPASYTRLIDATTSYKGMKVRLKNTALTASLSKIQASVENTSEITKVSKNETVHLKANANTGTTADGVNTVSAVVFQRNTTTGNDDFKYYKPLESAKGDGLYSFDTTGMEVGKYKVAIVNEVYNESSTAPTDSSMISSLKELEIVLPLSNLAFSPTSNLKYNANVNVGNKVGSISSQNGAGTPVYTLVADAAHAEDVSKFEIGTDGKTIQVKGNALDAGAYTFKIQAQDANGDPVTPLEISATITVSKASVSSMAFNDPNQTKKSLTDAQTPWNEIATSTPTNGELKVTYSKKSGDVGIITLDDDTGEVKAASENGKGKLTIQATVDDDPSTGKDNYEATSATKDIMIYQGVNGYVTPDSASSDANNPTFGAMDNNIKVGGTIGVISGREGTPDNGATGTTTYTYGLKTGGDASYFGVNPTTGKITSKVNLGVDTYTITVSVSDKWSTKEIAVTIHVGKASAEILKFYDFTDKTTIITTKSASLNESGIRVLAEVKGSSNSNQVKYGIKDGESTAVVDVHASNGDITIKSVGTTTITATKQGEVGQSDAYVELVFTITEGTQNFIYVDSAGNELSKKGDGSYQSYKEAGKDVVYQKDKSFQLYTAGAPSGADIEYELKSDSMADVIRVDIDGKVSILNASLPIQIDKIIVQATSKDPNGNYADKTIEIAINIAKAEATINFNDPNLTKKSITDAQTPWNEIATSTPTNDELIVTYSKQSGDIGVVTLDPATGEVKASSSNVKGKLTIQATVDDDPATGKDNYEATSTTKDIMIYQEVNGSVTPDSASSDPNNPTFGAMDDNIKAGGAIGVIIGSEGTPDNGVSGTTTYTYGLKSDGDSSYFSVHPITGAITSKVNLSVETYTITVTVSDEWSTKEIPVTISVGQASAEVLKFYDANNKNTIITSQSASLNESGIRVFAEVKGSSNTNTVRYGIKNGASTSVVDVHPTSGAITIKGVGTTTITATKQGEVGQADAYIELNFIVTEGTQNFIYTDNAGNELPKNGDGSYQAYKETGKEVVYQKEKNFQLYTNGAPAGATITYALKNGSPMDVVRVDADGKLHILNASLPIQTDKIIVEATSQDPNGNYADKTIEIAINIAKAEATISFNGITNVISGTGSVEPLIIDQNISSSDGGANVSDTQYIVSVDPSVSSDIAWSNDGKTINYDYSEEIGIDIPLKVTKPANRNYNKAEAVGTLHILSPTENILEVSSPGKVIYGDTFTIRSLQDDSSSTNVTYTFTSKDTTYVQTKEQVGNQMSFDAIKASGNTEIEVQIERSADGELPLSKTIKVKVLPKEISIKVDDKEKLYGEQNPVLSNQDFTNQLISWNDVKDSIQANDIKLSSIATVTSGVGTYDINVDIAHLNKTYANYNFKFTKGTLTITEEQTQDDWYHMETSDGNPYKGTWVNQDVKIIPGHPDYTELSTNKQIWQNELLMSVEGRTKHSFYMKKATGAISSSKEETVLIDKTPPKIVSIKGIETPKSRMADFLNTLTFNTFYKPGVTIEIQAEDSKAVDIEISEVDTIKYMLYEKDNPTPIETNTGSIINGSLSLKIQNPGIYKVCAIATDKAGNASSEQCEEIDVKKIDVNVDDDDKPDFNDPDGDGCADLNIKWKNPDNSWTKLNIDQNGDGIPEMNIDSRGSGIADLNVDTDNDGKPDLNLVVLTKEQWKPTVCVTTQPERYCTGTAAKAQINIDLDNDMKNRVPDININTNGEMKAEINITKPSETKPYLNIASEHSKWVPNKDYTYETFMYDTDTSYKAILNVDSDGDGKPDLNIDFVGETAGSPPDGKPDLNIDANGDGIPETDIDTDGDGKPDINLDTNKDGKPDENIIEIAEWKPEANGDKDGFLYDTMGGLNGNDHLKDNDVIVNNPGGSFLPNYALKANKVTDTISEVIKGDISNKANGQVIEEIYDVKLMKDNIQIQPDGKLEIRLPIPEGINNPHLVVEQKDGTYSRVIPKIQDGYLIYESDFLGRVGIVGDHREVQPPKEEIPDEIPQDKEPIPDTGGVVKQPDTSVKGAYTTTGSNTGDTTSILGIVIAMVMSIIFIIIVRRKQQRDTM